MKKTRTELENKMTQIKASRWVLIAFLFVEIFILLMHFPGFLGVKEIENGLIFLRTLLVDFFWPKNAADMVSYKGTVYEICTWFKKQTYFDLLVQVIIYLGPALFALTFVRTRILAWRIQQLDKPEKPDTPGFFRRNPKPEGKKPSAPQVSKAMEWGTVSGLPAQEAREANEYCEKHRQRCDNPFDEDPGLRIQRPVGEIGMGESRDFVKPWDENGEIDLTAILRRPVMVRLEGGKPYFYTKNENGRVVRSTEPMNSYTPVGISSNENRKGQVVCIITWLGGF